MSSWDEFYAEIEAEAKAEGPAAVRDLRAKELKYSLISSLIASRVAVTQCARRAERFLRAIHRARSCDARIRSLMERAAGTRGRAMSRRLARMFCMDSNRPPHWPH